MQLINPYGFGTISLSKLLNDDFRFDLFSVIDKNFVADSEMKRIQTRNAGWDIFNKVFGGDFLDIEGKYKQKYSGRLKLKGVFIGNLPIVKIDSPAAIERMIIIQTKNDSILPHERIPNIELTIFEKEGDAIATYLAQLLKILIAMNFIFPEIIKLNEEGEIVEWKEIEFNEKAQLLDMLSDPVENFIEEKTAHSFDMNKESGDIPVDDVYEIFIEWCKEKGIVPLVRQTFIKKFSSEYQKKRVRINGKRIFVFTDLVILNEDDNLPLKVGHPLDSQKDTQDKRFDDIEPLANLLFLKLILTNEKENNIYNKVSYTKFGQGGKSFKVITGLTSRFKERWPTFFLGSEKGSEKPPESPEPLKPETPSPLPEKLKDSLKYFKSEFFFSKEAFLDMSIEIIDYYEYQATHYYALKIPEDLKGPNALHFSNFSIKAIPITEIEFNHAKSQRGGEET
jgi:hypothetical protein